MKRALLERRIIVPLLVAYMVLLVAAGWRHEIRPQAFDGVTDFARGALRVVGISPGVAVFTADKGGGPDEKIAAICLEVRGVSKKKAARRIYPKHDAPCPAPSPRLWVRGEEIFLGRSVVSLRAAASARRAGDSSPARDRLGKLLAQSIGAHFLARDRLADADTADRYLLLWKESRISYRTGSKSDRIVALLSWRRASMPGVFVVWRPNEATLRERGWGLAEP